MNSIVEQLTEVRKQITNSCRQAKREPHSVQLIAVSKTKPASAIETAYQAEQRHFGENYVQELVEKHQQLATHSDIVWHFIGPIQSNKTKDIAACAAWVHSVDRLKVARRLNDQRNAEQPPLQVLIQVNIDEEESKAGVAPATIEALAATIDELPRLCLRGLMAIPSAHASAEQRQQSFAAMQRLYSSLSSQYKSVDTLSMGMTDDLDLAIQYGATMVRIGTAIFGART